jgi:hypothetical protein
MRDRDKLTTVELIEYINQSLGLIPDYTFPIAKIAEKEHIKRAYEHGAISNGRTFEEYYSEYYQSDEMNEVTNRFAYLFSYASLFGLSEVLKKFNDQNKPRENQP